MKPFRGEPIKKCLLSARTGKEPCSSGRKRKSRTKRMKLTDPADNFYLSGYFHHELTSPCI
ncbi:hypothetical protein HMPREF9413_0809 [Paenibacillus sp. HGF7]|nr:hypothetical protein HMPREF9413_0809 [Paenibacillus sp. HGF7]